MNEIEPCPTCGGAFTHRIDCPWWTPVDALKQMPEVAYKFIFEHAGNVEDLPNELQCICDAALARLAEYRERTVP
jgi:hypothetical protein